MKGYGSKVPFFKVWNAMRLHTMLMMIHVTTITASITPNPPLPGQRQRRSLAPQTLGMRDGQIGGRRGDGRWTGYENLGGDRHVPIGVAYLCEGLGDRRGGAEDDQVGRHQTTGRGLLVREEAPHD